MSNCPFCNQKMFIKSIPFTFRNHHFGQYDALYCDECNEYFYTEDSVKKIQTISKKKGLFNKNLSLKEIILLILGARRRPVFGKTTLVKELFLTETENPMNFSFQTKSNFQPHYFGPYDFNFDKIITELILDDYISVENNNYSLSEKGRLSFKALTSIWEINELIMWSKIRKSWDQKGTYGLMKYIYSNYPRYQDKSKVINQFSDL